MRIMIIDTYYQRFLKSFYIKNLLLSTRNYETQRQQLLTACFGTSDFYSKHLNDLGYDACDFVVNCVPLQKRWAKENNVPMNTLAMRLPHRFFRLPTIGPWLSSLPGLLEVAISQVQAYKPDILYCQDLSFFPGKILKQLKQDVGLVVGQIACPLPPDSFLSGYDLILTSFPHFVQRIRNKGISSEYFRIGFDDRISELIGKQTQDISLSFVGGISRHHGKALPLLEKIASQSDMKFYGYGKSTLPWSSPIRHNHQGEVWGLDMYRALARSRVTFNRHIDVAETYANNMRLYEATGVGAMLITDYKDNLSELFEIGKEVIAYRSPDEAIELANYYIEHPNEASIIARAGQARTLRDHTYRHRMQELTQILNKHYKSSKC